MNFNRHSDLVGQHAFLGASSHYWLNYDEEKLKQVYINRLATERGTKLHELAHSCIDMGVKIKGNNTLALYVNDAISYRLAPEQVLYYSRNCFGTADAISFNERTKTLRIHDLKTGVSPASMKQLEIYAALFCLEYHVQPSDIKMELRIYKDNQIQVHSPPPEEIEAIMHKIIAYDKVIEKLNAEV